MMRHRSTSWSTPPPSASTTVGITPSGNQGIRLVTKRRTGAERKGELPAGMRNRVGSECVGGCHSRACIGRQGAAGADDANTLALSANATRLSVLATAARRGSRPSRASPSPTARRRRFRSRSPRRSSSSSRTTAWWVTCAARRRARPCGVSPTSRLRPSAGLALRSTSPIFASRSTDLETPLGLRLRCSPSSPIASVPPGAPTSVIITP